MLSPAISPSACALANRWRKSAPPAPHNAGGWGRLAPGCRGAGGGGVQRRLAGPATPGPRLRRPRLNGSPPVLKREVTDGQGSAKAQLAETTHFDAACDRGRKNAFLCRDDQEPNRCKVGRRQDRCRSRSRFRLCQRTSAQANTTNPKHQRRGKLGRPRRTKHRHCFCATVDSVRAARRTSAITDKVAASAKAPSERSLASVGR